MFSYKIIFFIFVLYIVMSAIIICIILLKRQEKIRYDLSYENKNKIKNFFISMKFEASIIN
jgi:preprotein translocase subunit SecG